MKETYWSPNDLARSGSSASVWRFVKAAIALKELVGKF